MTAGHEITARWLQGEFKPTDQHTQRERHVIAQEDFDDVATQPKSHLMLGDCLDRMREIPDASVDMVLADLPYGTTQNKWDSVIPLEPLWREYWRVCKPAAAVVLTAAQPFTSTLVASQIRAFKYDWVWQKNRATNVFNAKKQPLRDKEDVLVFCRQVETYNPQGLVYAPEPSRNGKKDSENWGRGKTKTYVKEFGGYPKQVLRFDSVQRVQHPTQKPVALFEYLIRTYTNPGDMVLDNTMGSGTTGVACAKLGRKFIGIEIDEGYFNIACERIRKAYAQPDMFIEAQKAPELIQQDIFGEART